MKAFVTGAAGFIGSNLVDRLLMDGHQVVGFDNFSSGKEIFLESAKGSAKFVIKRGDILDRSVLTEAMRGCDLVFHLAANADVRHGLEHPEKDLRQNTIGTFNVLESMRENSIRKILFASTGSVYGEANLIPTPEAAPFPIQTSLYGASKLAGEGLIAAYAAGYSFQAWIFRFVGVLGERYTHGHIFDFCQQLFADRNSLTVLGNGNQRKSYIYVQDCISAMLIASSKSVAPVSIFNLGTNAYCTVRESVSWIVDELDLNPKVKYGSQERGWIGDSPFIYLDTSKIEQLGWRPKLSIEAAVRRTVRYLSVHWPEITAT